MYKVFFPGICFWWLKCSSSAPPVLIMGDKRNFPVPSLTDLFQVHFLAAVLFPSPPVSTTYGQFLSQVDVFLFFLSMFFDFFQASFFIRPVRFPKRKLPPRFYSGRPPRTSSAFLWKEFPSYIYLPLSAGHPILSWKRLGTFP